MVKFSQAQFTSTEIVANANVKALIEEANKLSVQRETFENEELARGNKAQYAILSKVCPYGPP